MASQLAQPQVLERLLVRLQGRVRRRLELEIGASCFLAWKLKNAELDLVVLRVGLEPRQWPAVEVWRSRTVWVTSATHRQHLRDPLPLSTSRPGCLWLPAELADCPWRSMTFRALEQAGRSYRLVSTAPTTMGMLAAAQAGLSVTNALEGHPLLEGLRTVRPDEGLPELPDCRYLMLKARDPRQPITDILAGQIHDVFATADSETPFQD